jgi:hypothetical protein
MRAFRYKACLPLAVLAVAASCSDPLSGVKNTNNPDRSSVLAKPSDVESLAGSLYQQIHSQTLGTITSLHPGLLTAAFENASGLANNGLGPRSGLPRGTIANNPGNPYDAENLSVFSQMERTARAAANILARASDKSFTLGSPAADLRMKAFTFFAYGVSLGDAALAYDSVAIPRPSDPASGPEAIPKLEGHALVMTYALQMLDSALAYTTNPAAAATGGFPLPAAWLPGNPLTAADFAKLIRSHRARFRADVARTPAERKAVDWNAVIADATNGIAADFQVDMNPSSGWDVNWLQTTLHFRDTNWHQMTPFIIGMADSSGGYDAWLATARDSRAPFLIKTIDKRFPAGEDRPAQNAAGQVAPTGVRYFRNRAPGLDQTGSGWANSQYDHYRFRAFADANRIGKFPLFTKAENDMLAAEGYIATGNGAAAAALIDVYRVRAGLPSLVAAGATSVSATVPGGRSCVPRVPVGPTFTSTACGSLLEAMKWEKRMETAYTNWGAWFFSGRGWGDLPDGTALEWPVPWQEMNTRAINAFYNLGGVGGPSSAGSSTYGFK